jgi:RNA polymerase sigma-70 factor, ECF subfamily
MRPPVPELLEGVSGGDDSALNRLVPILYDEMHRIAIRHLRHERAAHTLQPTALVHEAYLKLVGDAKRGFTSRAHFLAVASRVMRQILVDYARARATKKRAANEKVQLQTVEQEVGKRNLGDHGSEQIEILDLDRALVALSAEDESLARLIEMRYFGGMTAEETAEVVGQSVNVVRHDLSLSQAWLRRKLKGYEGINSSASSSENY